MALLSNLAKETNILLKLRLENIDDHFSAFDVNKGLMDKMRLDELYFSRNANGYFKVEKNKFNKSLLTFAASKVPKTSIIFAFKFDGLWQLRGGLTVTDDIGIFGYTLNAPFEMEPDEFILPSELRGGTCMIIGINTTTTNVDMTLRAFAEKQINDGPYTGKISWNRYENNSNIEFSSELKISNTVPRQFIKFGPALAQNIAVHGAIVEQPNVQNTLVNKSMASDTKPMMMKFGSVEIDLNNLPPLPEWTSADDESN